MAKKNEPKWMKRIRGRYRNVKGRLAEQYVAGVTGGKRVGGPGKHDVIKTSSKMEIKNRSSKVTKPELIRFKRRGVTKVVSSAGFTKPAIEYARKSRLKIYKGIIRRKRIK